MPNNSNDIRESTQDASLFFEATAGLARFDCQGIEEFGFMYPYFRTRIRFDDCAHCHHSTGSSIVYLRFNIV